MRGDHGDPRLIDLASAAEYIGVSPAHVVELASLGFLASEVGTGENEPQLLKFRLSDVKSFVARNADNGTGSDLALGELGVEDLLGALEARTSEMSGRAIELYESYFPEVRSWSLSRRARFAKDAQARIAALLALVRNGVEVDDALSEDLERVGATASRFDASLPELLVVLRIARDLVIRTAVEIIGDHLSRQAMALNLLLNRVIPAVDRLTDSIARGYWSAVVSELRTRQSRYENLVENTVNGVVELSGSGEIQYANPAFGVMIGRAPQSILGQKLESVMEVVEGSVPSASSVPASLELAVLRSDGVRRILAIETVAPSGEPVLGWQAVVTDVTAARDLEVERSQFLALVTDEFRQPLKAVLGLGATLESHAPELPAAQMQRIGGSVRRQAERLSRLADDLYDVSQLQAGTLQLIPRIVELSPVVEAAIDSLAGVGAGEISISVPGRIQVIGDRRRLEQVIGNLLEASLEVGLPPVEVSVLPAADRAARREVEVLIASRGPGIPVAMAATLFNPTSGIGTGRRQARDSGAAYGHFGLALAKGLVEASGGRLWYGQEAGLSCFHLVLPGPLLRVPAAQNGYSVGAAEP